MLVDRRNKGATQRTTSTTRLKAAHGRTTTAVQEREKRGPTFRTMLYGIAPIALRRQQTARRARAARPLSALDTPAMHKQGRPVLWQIPTSTALLGGDRITPTRREATRKGTLRAIKAPTLPRSKRSVIPSPNKPSREDVRQPRQIVTQVLTAAIHPCTSAGTAGQAQETTTTPTLSKMPLLTKIAAASGVPGVALRVTLQAPAPRTLGPTKILPLLASPTPRPREAIGTSKVPPDTTSPTV